jgi:hypothetical protein
LVERNAVTLRARNADVPTVKQREVRLRAVSPFWGGFCDDLREPGPAEAAAGTAADAIGTG